MFHHHMQYPSPQEEMEAQLSMMADHGEGFALESFEVVSDNPRVAETPPVSDGVLQKLAESTGQSVEAVKRALEAGTFRFQIR
jgi:hypothetical protein